MIINYIPLKSLIFQIGQSGIEGVLINKLTLADVNKRTVE